MATPLGHGSLCLFAIIAPFFICQSHNFVQMRHLEFAHEYFYNLGIGL